MNREDYIRSFQSQMVDIVANHLTPVAMRYAYSDVPLESNIKWRPQVLVIGNYSSGKSTLINDLLGGSIQKIGQAPTDDSFTIITCDEEFLSDDESVPDDDTSDIIEVTDERDGNVLLNDPEYPFESLKKHGERFASHFRLKKVRSPLLKNLAIVDTPGMLDSMSERDRGYNYQEVIGSLAQIADLVLVLFDPHKAGTIREAHVSLRETLPDRTFEDRVMFVLNRIDECASLTDMLRVYGTLCWNLSQITGRKDVPMIYLTYSPQAAGDAGTGENKSYLHFLENQREELKKAVLDTPRRHLDHLAAFIETHSRRLSCFLEGLIGYRRKFFMFRVKNVMLGLLASLACGGVAALGMLTNESLGQTITPLLSGFAQGHAEASFFAGGGVAALVFVFWVSVIHRFFCKPFHRKLLENIDSLIPLENQTRKDDWRAVRELALSYLEKTGGHFSARETKKEYADIGRICKKGSPEIREELNRLSASRNGSQEFDDSVLAQEPFRSKEQGIL